jgi:glycosyltransferase involved in cell wall biosynthesis
VNALFHAVAVRPGKEGGATRLISSLASSLVRVATEDTYTFCIQEGLELDLPAQINTVRVRTSGQLRRLWFDNWTWRRIVREIGPDVVVALLGFGAVRPRVAKISILPDYTYFCPNRAFGRSNSERLAIWIRSQILKASLRRASRVIAPSRSLAERASGVLQSPARIDVIRFGWDGDFEDPEVVDSFDGTRPLRLLYVSQLQPHKAHRTLPGIVAAARTLGVEAELTVAIDRRDNPRLWNEFHGEIRKHKVEDFITILSDQSDSDIARLYRISDVFLFPSVCESFGYPMVEATGAGLPVVAVDTEINREMLGDGALYYDQQDPEGAADKIAKLASDRDFRLEIVRRAQLWQRSILPSTDQYAISLHKIMSEVAS